MQSPLVSCTAITDGRHHGSLGVQAIMLCGVCGVAGAAFYSRIECAVRESVCEGVDWQPAWAARCHVVGMGGHAVRVVAASVCTQEYR